MMRGRGVICQWLRGVKTDGRTRGELSGAVWYEGMVDVRKWVGRYYDDEVGAKGRPGGDDTW